MDNLINSSETLYSVEKDVFSILNYFYGIENGNRQEQILKFKERIKDIFDKVKIKFKKVNDTLNKGYISVREREGIAVCFDIRQFTITTQRDSRLAIKHQNFLIRQLTKFFSNDFDDLTFTGDGYIFIKIIKTTQNMSMIEKKTQYIKFILSIIRKIYYVFDEIDRHYNDKFKLTDEDKLRIGVGISSGSLLFLKSIDKDKYDYFLGDAANKSSRMCDNAKPTGIIVELSDGYIDEMMLKQYIAFEKFEIQVKNDEKYIVMASPEVTTVFKYKYFYLSKNKNEKRIFIKYGQPCSINCKYCLSGKESFFYFKFEIREFIQEFRIFSLENQIDGYLFSVSQMNESIDDNNYNTTLEILLFLIKHTNNVIQIATKEPVYKIEKLFNDISTTCNKDIITKRLFILYSLSTVKYSDKLEKRRFSGENKTFNEELITLLNSSLIVDFKCNIIPYVKPFLPGITDKEQDLKDFLCKFPIVIIGYAYFSKEKINEMAEFYIKNILTSYPTSLDCYNFSAQRENTLPLSYPGYFKNLYAFDYSEPLEAFVNEIEKKSEYIKIFRSSPCAVAYLCETTSYTNVGNKDNSIHYILCNGVTTCANIHCLYNTPQSKDNLINRIILRLQHHNINLLDITHNLGHFKRVLNIAKDISEKYNLDDNNKTILNLVCLLHDLGECTIPNTIIVNNNKDCRNKRLVDFLITENVKGDIIEKVVKIVSTASFDDYIKEPNKNIRRRGFDNAENLICDILEDADKIDAIGAIGICRCFAFKKNRGLFNIDERPRTRLQLNDNPGYTSAINHFFEKLIHLYGLLNLQVSKTIAIDKHNFVLNFLNTTLNEYENTYREDVLSYTKIEGLKSLLNDKLNYKYQWWDREGMVEE